MSRSNRHVVLAAEEEKALTAAIKALQFICSQYKSKLLAKQTKLLKPDIVWKNCDPYLGYYYAEYQDTRIPIADGNVSYYRVVGKSSSKVFNQEELEKEKAKFRSISRNR